MALLRPKMTPPSLGRLASQVPAIPDCAEHYTHPPHFLGPSCSAQDRPRTYMLSQLVRQWPLRDGGEGPGLQSSGRPYGDRDFPCPRPRTPQPHNHICWAREKPIESGGRAVWAMDLPRHRDVIRELSGRERQAYAPTAYVGFVGNSSPVRICHTFHLTGRQ